MKKALIERLNKVAAELGIEPGLVALEYPEDSAHGDFSTNIALVAAKKLKISPKALAEKIVEAFKKDSPDFVESISIAGPGFVNFKVKDSYIAEQAIKVPEKTKPVKGKKVMIEYTDPNPFKVFHIGHLMSNAIGESLSRLIEHSGAKVIRACYQGDVGLHVAKTIWAVQKNGGLASADKLPDITAKVKWLGEMYVEGSKYDDDKAIQKEVADINKKIFAGSDKEISHIYDEGRKWSLEYFDIVYKRLGTKFDRFFFESEVDEQGVAVVKEFLKKGVFAESEGAIVFKGEDHGLHTRVFITSQGLPTYEAKEIGLNTEKFKLYPDLAESIIVTASEQNDYFKVLLKVLSLTHPDVAAKTRHMSHGMMRFQSGKMSSRKGNIVSGEGLIDEMREMVKEKMKAREFTATEIDEIADQVAIAAVKYSILRSSVGSDIIFDSAKSISFEGDSGPYLQYSAVRANSVLEKAKAEGLASDAKPKVLPEKVGLLERLITRFPDIAARASLEYAPQQIAGYLIELAGAFNSFYGNSVIVSANEPLSPYRIALTKSFVATMTDGLYLLGIKVPKKM